MFRFMALIFMAILVIGCGGYQPDPILVDDSQFEIIEIRGDTTAPSVYRFRDKANNKLCYANGNQGGIFCFDEGSVK